MMNYFLRIEDEPVAERRVVVTPDESPTGGTRYAKNADDEDLGLCRRCGKGTVRMVRFAYQTEGLPNVEPRCDRCDMMPYVGKRNKRWGR